MAAKAVISWSSGKDSAYALHEVRRARSFDVVGALTTITADYGRVSMHGVREDVLDAQMEAARLRCHKVAIPAPCPNEVYERAMLAAMQTLLRDGIEHVIFGDLYLRDVREYRETRLAQVGMRAVFPLWQRPTQQLAADMLAAGMRATLTSVDPRAVSRDFAGRRWDADLLAELPESADPCGENGEFHTLVTAGPMFAYDLAVEVGDVVDRDGFVFADVLLKHE